MDETELASGLSWKGSVVPSALNLLARGAKPASWGRFGMGAEQMRWLVLSQRDVFGMTVDALVAVVTEDGWFRCNLCKHKGCRPNPDHAMIAVSVHFSINHAMVGRGEAAPDTAVAEYAAHAFEAALKP